MIALDEDDYVSVGTLVVSSLETEDSWVLDSGCSYHMCLRKEYFETLKLEKGGIVLFCDNKVCKVNDIGMIRLKIFNDCELLIHNLLHVSMFDDLGYCTRVECGVLNISYDEMIIDKGYKVCGIYILEG